MRCYDRLSRVVRRVDPPPPISRSYESPRRLLHSRDLASRECFAFEGGFAGAPGDSVQRGVQRNWGRRRPSLSRLQHSDSQHRAGSLRPIVHRAELHPYNSPSSDGCPCVAPASARFGVTRQPGLTKYRMSCEGGGGRVCGPGRLRPIERRHGRNHGGKSLSWEWWQIPFALFGQMWGESPAVSRPAPAELQLSLPVSLSLFGCGAGSRQLRRRYHTTPMLPACLLTALCRGRFRTSVTKSLTRRAIVRTRAHERGLLRQVLRHKLDKGKSKNALSQLACLPTCFRR